MAGDEIGIGSGGGGDIGSITDDENPFSICDPDDDLLDRHSNLRDLVERPGGITDSTDLVETPLDPHDLCLNPGADEDAPSNPLCPVCEEPIRPVTGKHVRRFECECAVTWRFRFEEGGDDGD